MLITLMAVQLTIDVLVSREISLDCKHSLILAIALAAGTLPGLEEKVRDQNWLFKPMSA